MNQTFQQNKKNERGMALVTSLLAMTMLLALGTALVFSATTDTTTTKVQRVGEQSFFIADAGVSIARRSLAQALSEEIDKIRTGQTSFYSNPAVQQGVFPDTQVIPDPDVAPDDPFYQRVYTRAKQLAEQDSTRNQKFDQTNGSSFTVTYRKLTGTVTLVKTDTTHATQVVVFRYSFQVNGKTTAGGSAQVNEVGRLSANVNLVVGGAPGTPRDFAFSGFGAFFDQGDPNGGYWFLSPGTYSGAVHTNTNFAFFAYWQYNFRNVVSQVNSQIRYMDGSWNPNNWINIPTSNIPGLTLSSDGYKQSSAVPLPSNIFSQEYAVINGTGLLDKSTSGAPVDPPAVIPKDAQGNYLPVFDSNGRVTPQVLAANLRDTTNQNPTLANGQLPNGVFVSSADGSNIAGAGIYVQGDADDVQLYADTNGDQVYVIKQGSNTTTVRVDYTNSKTKVTYGNNTYTYAGIPTDKSDPNNTRAGLSLYVNGNINSLRGGKDSNANMNQPAIASKTALTITAARHMYIKGDLKYTDPVVNSDGTPISNISSVKNVLGLFTNDGNLFLDAKPQYVSSGLNIEIDSALAVFDSNPADNGGGNEGGLTSYLGGSGHLTPGSNDRIRLVGSDVEKRNSEVDYWGGDTYFDVRFSGGKFRPPFFPGTTYTLGQAPTNTVVSISTVDAPASSAMSWFVDNN